MEVNIKREINASSPKLEFWSHWRASSMEKTAL